VKHRRQCPHRIRVQVSTEDLHIKVPLESRHPFPQQDGQAVDFFAGCAARHPNADNAAFGLRLEQLIDMLA
jgi:hypothetical protein